MPEYDDAPVERTPREQLERECDITFFVAGGPGGQNRNKVATGVRLYHRPSGTIVTATERRSQSANREMAYARLGARLAAAQVVAEPRIATRPSRAARTRRIESKRQRGTIKATRRPIRDE